MNPVNRTPVSDQDTRLMAEPSIASQMPVSFKNGTSWADLEGQCKGCGEPIRPKNLTGRVTHVLDSVAAVEAVGVCHPCGLITRFNFRLHDDMRVTGPTDQGWGAWESKPTLTDRLRALIFGLFKSKS
jgi:hypothetical protein